MRTAHARGAYPRLCFVGPLLGRNPGCATTQGEILADLFEHEGYPVIAVSTLRNRYRRLADIVRTLVSRRREIDLQCLQVYGGSSFVVEDIASWLGRRFGHRIVMHLHGGAMPEFMARFPRWTHRVLRRADAFVTPSEFLARAVRPHGPRAEVIPNVIQLSDYPYRYREGVRPRLFWMRSFHPIYNPEMALRVCARLRSTMPDTRLVMAGQRKGLEDDVQRLSARLGLHDRVSFPGFLDMAGKAREGSATDIFLNTNRIDNMPVAVLEAGAMGLPVVSTTVGGVADLLVDGVTGLLVADDDDGAMAEAIRRLVDDPRLAGRLSANGRRLAETCSWTQVRGKWERVFAEMTARPGRDGPLPTAPPPEGKGP